MLYRLENKNKHSYTLNILLLYKNLDWHIITDPLQHINLCTFNKCNDVACMHTVSNFFFFIEYDIEFTNRYIIPLNTFDSQWCIKKEIF